MYPNLRYIELNQFDWIIENVKKELNSYLGRGFEEVCKEFTLIFWKQYSLVGRWWGNFREDSKRKSIEIDIVALNEKTKEVLFGECKWQDRVNAEKILVALEEKSKYVNWHNEKRKESYAVFAKSFKKRIEEYNGKKVYCFDLKDIEKGN